MGEQTFNISDENIEQHIITLFEKLECIRKESNSGDGGLSGRVPARLEVRTLSLWKAVVAECAASFLYVFIVCGAAGGAGVGASASAVLLSTALASGCAIATLTLCFANISGKLYCGAYFIFPAFDVLEGNINTQLVHNFTRKTKRSSLFKLIKAINNIFTLQIT